MPVPVPAVQEMLRIHRPLTKRLDFESGEVTTPTGCALALGLAVGQQLPKGWWWLMAMARGIKPSQVYQI